MYEINKYLYKNFYAYNLNKVSYRAYFIPFSNKALMDKTQIIDERYNSDMVKVLSGEWDFVYYDKCNKLPQKFDSAAVQFDKVEVPSTWQRTGYENPVYLNSRYMFRVNPPRIPSNIPVAVYRKKFVVDNLDKIRILTFLGACSTLQVYLNGVFVGYGEGSHNTAEFDITKLVNKGENELLVVVHKWCNGSYLECQDMFRENGIFRDVYITEYPNNYIYDYSLTCKYNNGKYDFLCDIDLKNPMKESKLKVELLDKSGKVVAQSQNVITLVDNESMSNQNTMQTFKFENLEVEEWSAEIPNLYTVIISLENKDNTQQYIRAMFGFKHIEILGDVFYFNNQKIKFKGVNHHDTDSKNGWVMTNRQLLDDVLVMKKYNFNTVRMSHYPPDPLLITLCDIYGLYVVDEMDVECHGIYSNPLRQRFGWISNNLKWRHQFLDRAMAMYYRDRNHCSIFLWSLGNEAGGYKCHDVAYRFFKSNSTIPVHYEGVIHTKRHSYDVISEMYPQSKNVRKIGQKNYGDKYKNKPYFMCEYIHAMGLGPGAAEEYYNIFSQYDNLMGGCVWEFCDHAVLNEEGSKYKYTYGGDHGEKKHDGNFCVDGLFFPDRTPSSGALNLREVYRPLRSKYVDGKVEINNTNFFASSENIDISYELVCNTQTVEKGKFDGVIKPRESMSFKLKKQAPQSDVDCFLNIVYTDKNTGEYIAKEQLTISQTQYNYPTTLEYRQLNYTQDKKQITVNFDNNASIVISKKSGEILSYTVDSTQLINQSPLLSKRGFLPNIYRGVIDNDRFIQILWNILGYHKAKSYIKKSRAIIENDLVKVYNVYTVRCFGKLASVKVNFVINAKGEISVTAKIKKALKLVAYSELPRFGLTLEMPEQFENVEYYGLGESENLCDFDQHAYVDVYNTKVSDMHDKYIKPQESGNRGKVRYFKVTNNDGTGLMFVHEGEYLNFNVNHYTLKDLQNAHHTEDLVNKPTTNVQIDGFYRGTGSQSCGQGPLPRFKFDLKDILTFSFKIVPIKK